LVRLLILAVLGLAIWLFWSEQVRQILGFLGSGMAALRTPLSG